MKGALLYFNLLNITLLCNKQDVSGTVILHTMLGFLPLYSLYLYRQSKTGDTINLPPRVLIRYLLY
jgi:hypothetical protein